MGRASTATVNKLTIVIVGEGGVGKSSLTLRFINKEFFDSYDPTIDDSYTISLTVDGRLWQIEVLDTAGQEEYRGLWVDHAISEGEAFIITYAINSTRSFRSVPDFLKLIANCKSGNSGYRSDSPTLKPRFFPFPFVIAGNKEDLIDQRTIPTSEGVQLANATGGLFYECSAKNATNVEEIFIQLIRSVAKLREDALAHRQNPKMASRPFIRNIGYQSQPTTHGPQPPAPAVQNQASNQNAMQRINPSPCKSNPVEGPAQSQMCAKAHECHDDTAPSTENKTTNCCHCVVI